MFYKDFYTLVTDPAPLLHLPKIIQIQNPSQISHPLIPDNTFCASVAQYSSGCIIRAHLLLLNCVSHEELMMLSIITSAPLSPSQ